jgi:hypothetical protein
MQDVVYTYMVCNIIKSVTFSKVLDQSPYRLLSQPLLKVTTSEKKTGLLLIETFSRQNYGHQGLILGGLFLVRQAWRVARKRHLIGCGG